jgi:hypothetical protein
MKKLTAEFPLAYGETYGINSTCGFTAGSCFFVTSMPMPGARENYFVVQKLGQHGFQRIQNFRDYVAGWDFGKGKPMSEIAFSGLAKFLETVILPEGKRPSIFLTSSGHLELAWEAQNGSKRQAEFGPRKIEYYREDTGAEGEIPTTDASQAAEILTA